MSPSTKYLRPPLQKTLISTDFAWLCFRRELAKNNQLPLIGSRQSAFHQAMNKPCALTQSPQRMALYENFYIFCVACHIFVADDRRPFTFGMPIDHSKSQRMDDKLCLKLVW